MNYIHIYIIYSLLQPPRIAIETLLEYKDRAAPRIQLIHKNVTADEDSTKNIINRMIAILVTIDRVHVTLYRGVPSAAVQTQSAMAAVATTARRLASARPGLSLLSRPNNSSAAPTPSTGCPPGCPRTDFTHTPAAVPRVVVVFRPHILRIYFYVTNTLFPGFDLQHNA